MFTYQEIPTNENYNIRHFITNDGCIEFGFYQVAFGIRFRAGYTGNCWVEIDWCCGTLQTNLALAFKVFANRLKISNTHKQVFNQLPGYSKIKPFDNDAEFMKMIEDELKFIPVELTDL